MSNDRQASQKVYANRYRSVRLLGKGNFGQVYLVDDLKAKDRSQSQKVLKRITVGEIQPDESLDAVLEAKLMQKLEHPSIVRCYDSFLDGEFFCIVTEFCEGGDLDVCLTDLKRSKHYLEEDQILTWFVQLLCAVQYVHSRGVLHRDLKTRNIFIRDKMLKLGDFGISRILMSTSDMASTFVGTPYYMSPEVLKHDGYNSKSDIWSLGCILFEMCSLHRAFEGTNVMNVMWNIMQKEIPRIPSRYNERLQKLVDRILNRDPQKRPSALEILQNDYITQHIRRMSSNPSELGALLASPSQSMVVSSKREAAEIRTSANSHVNMQQLRQEEREKKLSNADPRQRRRMIKQEEADQRAEQLKVLARENREKQNESKQRKQSELRGSLTAQQEEAERERARNEGRPVGRSASNAAGSAFLRSANYNRNSSDSDFDRYNGIAADDGMFGPPSAAKGRSNAKNSSDDGQYNAYAQAGLSRTAPPGNIASEAAYGRRKANRDEADIPDDPYMAETHYGQERFDEDSDDEGTLRGPDDETVRDYREMLQNLQKHMGNGSRPSTSASRQDDNTVIETRNEVDAYGPLVRDTKIKNMRSQAIQKLSQARFDKVYEYLKKVRGFDNPRRANQPQPNEQAISNDLQKMVGKDFYSHCFLVDQLLFLEFD